MIVLGQNHDTAEQIGQAVSPRKDRWFQGINQNSGERQDEEAKRDSSIKQRGQTMNNDRQNQKYIKIGKPGTTIPQLKPANLNLQQ